MGLLILDFVTVLGMSMSNSFRVTVPLFLIYITTLPLAVFNLDVFLEEQIGDRESTTGKTRGLLLALMSIIGAIAPLFSGFLIDTTSGSFHIAFIASALMLLPIMFILSRYFKYFQDPPYNEVKILPSLRVAWINSDIRYALLSHFTLQIFFFWMVVYAPLYLSTRMHFSWSEIGLIIFAAQAAYIILEYPIGVIGDRFIGEKEMMALGMVILALSSTSMAFLASGTLAIWMTVMFISRIGASFTEVTTESYFFKHTKGADANIISLIRVMRPVAFVFGSLIGSLALLYVSFNLLFVILGVLMIPGLFYAMALNDTK
jgi:MFS family permease